MKMFYEKDADVNLIKSKKIAIFGYGSQGHAHALNLKDSGAKEVVVALRDGSASKAKAESKGLRVMNLSDAAEWAEVAMILTPDELQASIYKNHIEQRIKEGTSLAFAHGLNIHYKLIDARKDLDVFMVAPKGPGHLVRSEFERVEEFHVYLQFIKTEQVKQETLLYHMHQQLVVENLELLKQHLKMSVKLIYLESSQFFVVD